MEHRHLILAYAVTWLLHLGYLGWVVLNSRTALKIKAGKN